MTTTPTKIDAKEAEKRARFFLDIDPRLRNRVKAFAALQGKTMKEWITEAIIAKLEDDIDVSESMADMANDEDAIPLKEYLKAHQDKL